MGTKLTPEEVLKTLRPSDDLVNFRRKSVRSVAPVIEGENPYPIGWYLDQKPQPFNQLSGVTQGYMSWSYACANINANGVAMVPLRLYARKSKTKKSAWGTKKIPYLQKRYMEGRLPNKPSALVQTKSAEFDHEWEEVSGEHPALKLLHTVNQFSQGYNFFQLLVLNLQLTGNAYWMPVLQRGTNLPIALWPLMPQYVRIQPGILPGEPWIKGYTYGVMNYTPVEFAADEVIQFKMPNPADSHYGRGVIESLWQVISLNLANHSTDLAFVSNMNRPDFMVSIPDAKNSDLLKRMQSTIEKVLRGPANAGKFLAIGGDAKVTPLNFQPKDMMGREEVVEEICAGYGVPVSMVKANDPNKASAQTAVDQWLASTIQSYCRLVEAQLNHNYLPLWPDSEEMLFAFDNPVARDDAAARTAIAKEVEVGIRTPNEARKEMELPLMAGGDDLYILTRQGVMPLDLVRQQAESSIAQNESQANQANAQAEAALNPPEPPATPKKEAA